MSHTSLYDAPLPSFSTKEERILHLENAGFLVAQIVLSKEVTAHFGIGEAVTLTTKLGTSLNVNAAIGVIFDHFLRLREMVTGSSDLHHASPYWRLAKGLRDTQSTIGPLALLQSHLSLSTSDASGNTVRLLKRVVAVRGGAPRNLLQGSQRSVPEIATGLILRDCSHSADQTLSQKNLLSLLAKDSELSPPFLLQITLSEKLRRVVQVSAREASVRESLEQEAMQFLIRFAKPYLSEILNPDAALRSDWIVFQGHCRHKIHLLEAQSRMECSRRTILREESDQRCLILDEEYDTLSSTVLAEQERMGLIAIAAAGRAALADREISMRASIDRVCERELREIELVSKMSLAEFLAEASAECDESWLEMLRFFDRSAAAVLVQ